LDKAPDFRETFNGSLDEDGAPDDAPARLVDLQSRMKPVLFGRNKTRLSRDAITAIDALGEVIRRLGPDVRILVVGHSDQKGRKQSKLLVSEERAEAVRRALIRAGVSAKQIAVEGRGDSELVDPSGTPEAATANRRAVLELSLPPAVSAPITPADSQ
jgi:OOP family OmpA-OmpF porin